MCIARPFVKWAGGKVNLLKLLESQLPDDFDRQESITYIEPFVGGGSMLFHMLNNHRNIHRVIINDINHDLILCYQLIKDNPDALIKELSSLESQYNLLNSPEERKAYYYRVREQYNRGALSNNAKAAYLIFLNKTCFNGLYRVNLHGEFNVPYGIYRKQVICNTDIIYADHLLLQNVEIYCGSYEDLNPDLGDGYHFMYLDPPYRSVKGASNFRKYSEYKFEDEEQVRLKVYVDRFACNGCKIMLSNSDSENDDGTSFFPELYGGYICDIIVAPRYINSFSAKKKKQTEVLIKNYNNPKAAVAEL